MPEHTIRQGECISSISIQHGLFWKTVWDRSENLTLRNLRMDPNALYPGDKVFIPEISRKEESGAAEQKHRFKKKGVPAKLKIRFQQDGEPRANEPFELFIDSERLSEGTTDADGFVEHSINPSAGTGKIILGPPEKQDIFEFNFGTIDPLNTQDGVKQRLLDMGYPVEEDLAEAIKGFQKDHDMTITGDIDDATRSRLQQEFGQ